MKNPENFDIIDIMKQWEYMVIDMVAKTSNLMKSDKAKKLSGAEILERCINDVGKEGWEFCFAQENNFLFKRSKNEDVEFKGPLFEKKI